MSLPTYARVHKVCNGRLVSAGDMLLHLPGLQVQYESLQQHHDRQCSELAELQEAASSMHQELATVRTRYAEAEEERGVLLRRLRHLETEEMPAVQRREKASAEEAADTSRRLVQTEVGRPAACAHLPALIPEECVFHPEWIAGASWSYARCSKLVAWAREWKRAATLCWLSCKQLGSR